MMLLKTDNVKKLFILVLVMACIALFFWDQSRIPALTEKAQMGVRTQIDAIAFDILFPVLDSYPLHQRIFYSSINWAYTNWKGMTFGLLFGAACLSLIRLLPQRSSGNIFLNALKGAFIGAPLGVCVNCSTPIMQGMQRGGMRLETVLATLASSPTLNIIVLTMSFSLLPLEFAIAKLAAVLLFVLGIIPLLAHTYHQHRDINPDQESRLAATDHHTTLFSAKQTAARLNFETVHSSWLQLLTVTLADYLKSLWFIIKIALPFMLLAGLLGAIAVELVPLEGLDKLPVTFLSLLLVALIGTFLPLPIAMDVLLVSILLSAGMPTPFAMTLLFTFGIFSIYPFLVIWRDISRRIALGLFGTVVLLGIASGLAVTHYQNWHNTQISEQYISALQHSRSNNFIDNRLATFMLQQVDRECRVFDTEKAQQQCLREYLLHRVQQDQDNGLCFGLQDKNLRSFCFQQASILVTIKDAIKRDKPEACENIGIKTIIDYCKNKVIFKSISGGSPLSRCESLSGQKQIDKCKIEGFFTRLSKYNDTNVCENFSHGKERQDCQRSVRVFKQALGNHAPDCLKLPLARNQELCRGMVAKRQIIAGGKISNCNVIQSPSGYQKCRDFAHLRKATDEADASLCQLLNTKEAIDKCTQKVINTKINRSVANHQIGNATLASVQKDNKRRVSKAGKVDLSKIPRVVPEPQFIEDNIQVSATPYRDHSGSIKPNQAIKVFSTNSYHTQGIRGLPKASLLEFKMPLLQGRGIASGDYNNDHWPDLLFASRRGLKLYTNIGDGIFAQTSIQSKPADSSDIQLAAFIDINNDGWQDIYAAGYGGKNYFILNDRQGFSHSKLVQLKNSDANQTMATAFADIDSNGQLDIILGNWSFGLEKNFQTNYSKNLLYLNRAMNFQAETLTDELNGETLSTLFSDINQDGRMDLVIANDLKKPDFFYLGTEKGKFRRVTPQDGLIKETSFNTMGIDSADFNNDLRLDLFSVDMSFSGGSEMPYCDAIADPAQNKRCHKLLEGKEQITRGNIRWCQTLDQADDRRDCMTAIVRDNAMAQKQASQCQKILPEYSQHKLFCEKVANKDPSDETIPLDEHHPQVQSNKLFLATDEGHFRDATAEMGVAESYWSWNAKAADLDNDGWQDIYIGNGFGYGEKEREVHSNILFHNQQGKGFVQAQEAFGLVQYTNTPSYTYSDIDLDGDLDIITTAMLAEGNIFINNNPAGNHAISIALRDETANHFAIGARVMISTDQGQQLRELKLGGGFLSYDNPVMHFGLGRERLINKVEIIWPDGVHTVFNRPFEANRHYQITRLGESKSSISPKI